MSHRKEFVQFYFYEFQIFILSFRKAEERGAQKLDSDICDNCRPTVWCYRYTYLRDVLRAASVYSSSSRCTSVSNAFPIFRTVAPTDACQSAVTARVIAARPLPSTESTHRSHVLHSRTVCCQTVRDRSRRDNVVTITPNNRYLSAHSKISCGR